MKISDITEQIKDSQHIVLMGHMGGDVDCYGSMFALKQGLETLGKKVDIISPEEYPESLGFLFFYFQGDIKVDYIQGADTLILLDSSDVGRLVSPSIAKAYIDKKTKILLIDHHTQGDLSQIANPAYVCETACSTSEIIYHLLVELGAKIDKNIATCLLAGIMGDTTSFQNQNTTESCFAVASDLMKLGARQRVITDHLFGSREVDTLKIWGVAMERLTEHKQLGVVSTYLTYEDIVSYGLSPDVVSGVVNYLNSIKGARIVMLIAEEEKGTIKVSLRTRDEHVNVASMARQLGGGGHVKAAGFSFPGSLNVLTQGPKSHIVIS